MEARRWVSEPLESPGSRVTSRESLRFLARAGQALAGSLDYEDTLQRVAELAVPRVACYCVVDVIEEGQVRRVGMAHVDRAKLELLRRTADFPLDPGKGSPLSEALSKGDPVLLSIVTEESLRGMARSPEHLDMLRALAPTSWILSPLIVRGRALGAIVFASTRTDRHYREKDLPLARELARTAALAIDNARVHRRAEEAIRARDEVLRVVSHDLRNPMSAVTMAAALLEEGGPEELQRGIPGRLLHTIRRASEQATRMIDDLLDVARIETGRLAVEVAPESVASMLAESVDLHRPLAEQRGINIELRASASLPHAMADRMLVSRLVGNLLGNAIKFTPEGGQIEVGAEADADRIRAWVSDTGPGIPAEQLPHVFDRFWQARRSDRRGLGLGLTIVRALVEAQGGDVWVTSEVGSGTRVDFTLPCATEAAA
jgi:signal transduction histidine kinase